MQTFGEQLTAARKAKGMTQEALSQAAAVTRQTVSSWERGRTIPDIDTIRHLSDILGTDLIRAAEGESAPAVESIALPERQDAPAAAGNRQIKKWWIVAGAAALVCAAIVLSLLLASRKPAPAGERDTFPLATYQQETPNEAGKAYITFDNRTWIENNGGTDYQMYDFTMTEKNGIAFSISRVEVKLLGTNGKVRSINMSADDLVADLNPDFPAYGSGTISGGSSVGNFTCVGIAVYGTDANGEALTFYNLIEF